MSDLIRKLQMKPGHRALILNAPAGYSDLLAPLPEGVEPDDAVAGTYDWVHLFVRDSGELARLAPAAIGAVNPGGILWISYPKKSSGVETDLTRDHGWEPVLGAGLTPVSQVAVDDVWSALRFRPAGEVKTTRAATPGERPPIVPPDDFRRAMEENGVALEIFEKLAYTHRKEYVRWIEEAKKPETRARRIEKAVAMIAEGKKLS